MPSGEYAVGVPRASVNARLSGSVMLYRRTVGGNAGGRWCHTIQPAARPAMADTTASQVLICSASQASSPAGSRCQRCKWKVARKMAPSASRVSLATARTSWSRR